MSIDLTSLVSHSAQPAGSRWSRRGSWVLMGGLLAGLVWAAFAPLDEGIPAPATVAVDSKRKSVQHLQGGIVTELLVREGSTVSEGDPLVRLDESLAKANFESIRQRYIGLRAMESRLLSEQSGADRITWHPDLKAAESASLAQRHMAAQEQLFTTRRLGLMADLQAIEEAIRGQEVMAQSYSGMIESRQTQKRLIEEQLLNVRGLVKDGYAPRNQQLELERQVAELLTNLTDLQGNIARGRQLVAELRQRAISAKQQYRRETDSQLAEVSREVQADQSRLESAQNDLERSVIRAPVDGQVVGLAMHTIGGVLAAGQKVMDIVPAEDSLTLETHIPPHLIDAINPGLKTDVRFSNFAHSPQLVVEGEVVSVSGDLLTDQTAMGPVSYYLTRVRITPEGMKTLGKHQLRPGMNAEVIIKTGERTVLTYLLHPLTRRVSASMKEQ